VLKDDALEAVVQAVRAAAAGGIWLSPAVLPALVRPTRDTGHEALTPREREILALVAAGRSTKEIARVLGIGAQTVSNALSVIYAKLGVPNRAAAAVWARDHGLD
jgi:DNA-binding NarL/FixJ family response regulator